MYYPKNRRDWFFCIISVLAFIGVIVGVSYFSDDQRYDLNEKKLDVVRIGVLDGERLKAEARCFKSHEKIAEMVTDLLSKVRTASVAMKKSYDEVKKDTNLTQKKRNAELSKIEAKWNADSARYNAEMQKIRNLDAKLTDFIQDKLNKTIDNIVKVAHVDIILNKGSRDLINVFYNSKNIDITDIVIKQLDESIPKIDLEELAK